MATFDEDYDRLKALALRMGGLVERAIFDATRSVTEGDVALANRVIEHEGEINGIELQIDESIVEVLSGLELQPEQLRNVLAVGRINADLERIGDQAVNIAEAALRLVQHPRTDGEVDLPRMAAIAAGMVRDALDALVNADVQKARQVLTRDDDVDEARDHAFRVLLAQMVSNSTKVFPAFDLILVAKDIERIGDLATNIAEAVIFAANGQDVRHSRNPSSVS